MPEQRDKSLSSSDATQRHSLRQTTSGSHVICTCSQWPIPSTPTTLPQFHSTKPPSYATATPNNPRMTRATHGNPLAPIDLHIEH
ncbi:hypothetical protein KC19_10G126200 [Ceratodon purpureus]|uniref:Uncharacterized protein n=1 Tax=Ceratodon purpureus TaxID=3225 RepID=A0A8T0GS11_CERPU|nr:hypothetical protein KC19_10G126200 [Ceratodon purpureus]